MTYAQPIRYVLSDVDGTLLPIHGSLPREFRADRDTLSQLIRYGNEGASAPIGFCTGREISYLLGVTKLIEAPNSWSVVENGICLYNFATGERVNHPLLTEETESIFRGIRERAVPQITRQIPLLEPYLRKEINIALEGRYPQINPDLYTRRVWEVLAEFAEHIDIISSGHAIDIMPKGINKGSGLRELCKLIDVPLQQFLLIGDSPNDFSAMELAGYVGCPANASEECKEFVRNKGGYIAKGHYVVGVVEIISRYLSNGHEETSADA